MSSRLACATSSFGQFINLENVLESIASLGFKGVEFMSIPTWFEHIKPEQMNENTITIFRKKLSNIHLRPLAISGHCEMGKKEGSQQLEHRILLAANLGVTTVVCGSGAIHSLNEEKNFFEGIKKCSELAEEKQIILALETGGNFIPTGRVMKEIIQEVNAASVKVTYDPANVMTWGKANPMDDIFHVMDVLHHVHLKDHQHNNDQYPPLGDGDIDFNNLFRQLYDNGFEGNFGIEVDCFSCSMSEARKKLEKSLHFLFEETLFLNYFS